MSGEHLLADRRASADWFVTCPPRCRVCGGPWQDRYRDGVLVEVRCSNGHDPMHSLQAVVPHSVAPERPDPPELPESTREACRSILGDDAEVTPTFRELISQRPRPGVPGVLTQEMFAAAVETLKRRHP